MTVSWLWVVLADSSPRATSALPEIRFSSKEACTTSPIPTFPVIRRSYPVLFSRPPGQKKSDRRILQGLVADHSSQSPTNHHLTGKFPLQLKPNGQMETVSCWGEGSTAARSMAFMGVLRREKPYTSHPGKSQRPSGTFSPDRSHRPSIPTTGSFPRNQLRRLNPANVGGRNPK
jgi:hypothetical protein